jgi:hypothetical protein
MASCILSSISFAQQTPERIRYRPQYAEVSKSCKDTRFGCTGKSTGDATSSQLKRSVSIHRTRECDTTGATWRAQRQQQCPPESSLCHCACQPPNTPHFHFATSHTQLPIKT